MPMLNINDLVINMDWPKLGQGKIIQITSCEKNYEKFLSYTVKFENFENLVFRESQLKKDNPLAPQDQWIESYLSSSQNLIFHARRFLELKRNKNE